jgi:NTE family protein
MHATSAPSVSVIPTPSIALALGGGGARGLAHVLVLEVLDELGIKPKIIAGTSIGALVGAAYALGMPALRIRAMFEETLGNRFDLVRQLIAARSDPVQKLLRLVPLRTSLLGPEALLELLAPEFDKRTFADLVIPLKVVATDLIAREPVVIAEGPLRRAVAASIAIPLLFSPVSDGTRVMVDGGLVNPLPFDLLTGAADINIAIDVSGAAKEAQYGKHPTALDVLVHSLQIMEKSVTRQKLNWLKPDIYFDVDLDQFGALEFWRAKDIFEAAQPVKAAFRRQLQRVISARPLEIVPPDPADGRERRR